MSTDCLKIPGYEFWIEIDGRRATQYRTQVKNELGSNVVSCYIASEVGKEFRIGIRRHRDSQLASVRSYVNDDGVDKRFYRNFGDHYVSHLYTAVDEKRRFAFSKIKFEEDELAELTSIPPNLGTIRLEIFRVAKLHRARSVLGNNKISKLNTPTLSEKSKAIRLHTTALLKPEKVGVQSRNHYSADYIDSGKSPWYTVKFFYRPLDTLQAEGIVPVPATTSGRAHGRGERNARKRERRSSNPAKDQKPFFKTDILEVEGPKAASREEPIIIEDSDEDSKFLFNKRVRESLDLQVPRKKRKDSHPVTIDLD